MDYYNAAAKRITDFNPDVKINLQKIGSFDHIAILDETDASNPAVADIFALPADRFYQLGRQGSARCRRRTDNRRPSVWLGKL